MSDKLNFYVTFLVFISILLYSCLIYFTKSIKYDDSAKGKHSFDGITELNEPLPSWWLWLSVYSIIFAIGYLFLYPGLGKFKGFFEWSSHKECDEEILNKDRIYNPIYIAFYKDDVETLSTNLRALKIGKSIFINNCSICHGLDAKGGNGFPNLTNNKWLYGGTPVEIKASITNGRKGKMPTYATIIGSEINIEATALYVLSLSGKEKESELTDKGKVKFVSICAACHGLNAKGNKYIGAPDLIDPQWIYGGTLKDVKTTIKNGRSGIMPSHKDVLTKEQIHILTAYIFFLNKS